MVNYFLPQAALGFYPWNKMILSQEKLYVDIQRIKFSTDLIFGAVLFYEVTIFQFIATVTSILFHGDAIVYIEMSASNWPSV